MVWRIALGGALILAFTCGACNGDSSPETDTGAPPQDISTPADTTTPDTTTQDTTVPQDSGKPPQDTSSPEDTSSSDTSGPQPGQACPNNDRVGYIEVANWDFYSTVAGQIYDAVNPLEVLQPKETQNGCTLMMKKNPFCDPPCGAGNLCNHGGECVPYPVAQNIGTVTVTGLLKDVSMEPGATNMYSDSTLPFPCYEPGAKISVTATGGDLTGFTLNGTGVATLEIAAGELLAEKGKDLQVTWTPAEGEGKIHMRLNVDQHGNSPVTMVCDVDDTGTFAVPGSLVTTLLEYGVSGFATFDIYRRTVDSVTLGVGCVELRVLSWAQGKVVVEGHVPCFSDKDCPEGETCKVEINTCTGAGN